jgi:adenylylsulfate kinase-like enzyme
MIIWITGQHNAGKSTLAKSLKAVFDETHYNVVHLDGDAWRELSGNKDYSESGRRRNIGQAMSVALLLNEPGTIVICSFISPYRDQRETLKSFGDVLEVYVYTTRRSQTPERIARGYQPPQSGFLKVCTDHPLDMCTQEVVRAWSDKMDAERCGNTFRRVFDI